MDPNVRHGETPERALLEVVTCIIARPSLEELFEDLTAKLSKFVQFDRLILLLHDEQRQSAVVAGFYSTTPHKMRIGFSLPLHQTPAGEVIRDQKPHHVPDVATETSYPELMSLLREEKIRAICHLPLTSPSHRIGALVFATQSGRSYSAEDLDLMEIAMKPVAIAVENVLNRQRLEQERDRFKLMLNVNNALVTKLDVASLFDEVSGLLREYVPHEFLSLAMWNAEEQKLRLRAAAGPASRPLTEPDFQVPLENTPSGIAFTSGEPQIFGHDRLSGMAPVIQAILTERRIRSMCSLPLQTARGRIGAISVGSRSDSAYTPEMVRVLSTIAGQVGIAVENALTFAHVEELNRRLNEAKTYLEEELHAVTPSDEILGVSSGIRKVLQQIETVAPTDATVLVYGETGSGKELVARALHQKGARSGGTFVKLNCAAIPTGLLESELFGHEKGAFTGAIAQKAGRFEIAHQGTLFLDEIGEIPLELQPKLLRVLQEKEFERLGGIRTMRSDARLVAATNRDLKKMCEQNQFRTDLYYRLNVFPIGVPPLRDRREDIPVLAAHFTAEYSRRFGRNIRAIASESMDRLIRYHWPGNIRELQNLIERSAILTTGDTLRIPLHELEFAESTGGNLSAAVARTMKDVERDTILQALKDSRGVIGGARGAAAKLGLKRTTLLYKMERLGISKPE